MSWKYRLVSLTLGWQLLAYSQVAGAQFELYKRTSFDALRDEMNTVKVFGLTQKNAVSMDGDPNGTACSKRHYNDDISNRWCHSIFVKIVDTKLRDLGVPKSLAALAAGSIFLPKEFLIDQNPSPADLMIADFGLYQFAENSGNVSISLFGDGATILSIEKTF